MVGRAALRRRDPRASPPGARPGLDDARPPLTARGLTEDSPVPGTRFRRFRRSIALAVVVGAAVAAPARGQAPVDQSADVAGGSAQVFQYGFTGRGLLTPLSPPSFAGSASAAQLAVTPDGISVYVGTDAGIDRYDRIDPGFLGPKSPASVAVPNGIVGIVAGPSAGRVYATAPPSSVFQFAVALGGTSARSRPPPVPVPGNLSPGGIATSPDGASVYVAAFDLGPGNAASVAQYTVGPNGLTPKIPASVPAGSGPAGLGRGQPRRAVRLRHEHRQRHRLPVRRPGGTLRPKRPSTVQAGSNPPGIAVTRRLRLRLRHQREHRLPARRRARRRLVLSPELPSSGRDVLHGTAGADVTRRRTGDDVIRGLRGTTGSSAAPGATGSSAAPGAT
jgi:hypothetical protein